MEEVAYCNLLTQVLMYLHHGILKAQLKRLGFSVDNMDLRSTQEEPGAHNLAIRLTELKWRFEELDEQTQERVRHGSSLQLLHLQGAGLLHQGVLRFMEDFGHLSDSESDFSATPWRENPDAVLRMIVDYVPRGQAAGGMRRLEDLQVSPLRRLILRRLGERARTYSRHRDAISYLFTSSIALLRRHFLVLAEQWVQQGILGCPDDIFYLDEGELRQVAEGGVLRTEAGKLVVSRRREAEAWRNASPRDTLYGEQAPPLDTHVGQRLKGTPTSIGCYRGSVQVVRGIEEFHKVKAGDVLVIPYSDAGWTPLFARAGAVVAESGGMLSHSSIVAREYRIPAVVSVQGACALRDGCIVTVDGYRGEVLIEEQGAGSEGPAATPRVPGPTDVGAQSEGSAAA